MKYTNFVRKFAVFPYGLNRKLKPVYMLFFIAFSAGASLSGGFEPSLLNSKGQKNYKGFINRGVVVKESFSTNRPYTELAHAHSLQDPFVPALCETMETRNPRMDVSQEARVFLSKNCDLSKHWTISAYVYGTRSLLLVCCVAKKEPE